MTELEHITLMRVAEMLRPVDYDVSRIEGIEYRPLRRDLMQIVDGDGWDCRRTSVEYVKFRLRRWIALIFPEKNIPNKDSDFPAEIIRQIIEEHDDPDRTFRVFDEIAPYVVCKLHGLRLDIGVFKDEYGGVIYVEDGPRGRIWIPGKSVSKSLSTMTVIWEVGRINGVGYR